MIFDRIKSRLGSRSTKETEEDDAPEVFKTSERPYIMCAIYYLAILLFIGLPIWYFTCSQTRHSLPDIRELETKLSENYPKLHLDVSVVQLSSLKNGHDSLKPQQSDYLRANLPSVLNTSIDGLAYNINWRIRRPTLEEVQLVKAISKESTNQTMTSELRHTLLHRMEENLLKIHKPANRFRLFMYIFGEPLNPLICDQSQTYLVNYERFIYLCPNGSDENLVSLIQESIHETFLETVDLQRAKKILSAKTDLLVSLVSEKNQKDLAYFSQIADKVHNIYDKNVKGRFLELAEVLNIRLITQNVFDLLTDTTLDSLLVQPKPVNAHKEKTNLTNSATEQQVRYLELRSMSRFYNSYERRLNKHSSQSVHHVVTLLPDFSKSDLAFETSRSNRSAVKMLEERDSNFILIGDSDKSLVLGMRAIIRRVIGLKSPNLCRHCVVRRDVFMNKWELDAIVGVLTALKLQSVYDSLSSVSKQTVGIKIPKFVSRMAFEAYDGASKSLENLALKKPLEAYRLASSAFDLSEAAYYHPSLLETSYYPQDTRWAIYTPLTLPLVMPIIMSVIRIVKYLIHGSSSGQSHTKQKTQ